MIDNGLLKELVLKYNDYAIEQRKHFHMYPELTSQEFETSAYLKREAVRMGLAVTELSGTGFLATLETGRPGPTLALRADIDGLPLQEAETNLRGRRKYCSQRPGICHACGHDAHMAISLASMQVLCELKEQLCGTIVFAFEEGEEGCTGIAEMTEALSAIHVDAIYGNHVTAFMDSGTVCLDAGPRMAGAVGIDMTLVGKSGHGSRPDLSINPIAAGAAIINQLSSVWTNQIDVTKTVTLCVTQFQAGTNRNIIPETAYLGGTCRVFDEDEAQKAEKMIRMVADHTASMYGCHVEYGPMARITSRPVVNDETLANLAQSSALEVLAKDQVLHGITWFASESFQRYSACGPYVLAFIGVRNEEAGSGAEHHNVHFDIDENALQTAVLVMCKFAIDFLYA